MLSAELIAPNFAPVWHHYKTMNPSLDRATLRTLSKMPEEVRYSFTPAQLAALIEANRPQQANHWINYRISIPFFGTGFYLRLFVGKERRNKHRLTAEGQMSLPKTSIGIIFGIWLLCCIAMLGSIIVLYLVKSTIGLDLMDGSSMFHPLFYN